MDVDRTRSPLMIIAVPSRLQWSHVLMDVDSLLRDLSPLGCYLLQWSHVLMDVDSRARLRRA